MPHDTVAYNNATSQQSLSGPTRCFLASMATGIAILLLGVLFYINYRNISSLHIFQTIGIYAFIQHTPTPNPIPLNHFLQFLWCSLPSFSASYGTPLITSYFFNKNEYATLCIFSFICFSLHEIFPLISILFNYFPDYKATFDINDIFALLLGSASAFLFLSRINRKD